jgi:hypothetical protein
MLRVSGIVNLADATGHGTTVRNMAACPEEDLPSERRSLGSRVPVGVSIYFVRCLRNSPGITGNAASWNFGGFSLESVPIWFQTAQWLRAEMNFPNIPQWDRSQFRTEWIDL